VQIWLQTGHAPSFFPSVAYSQPQFRHLNISSVVALASDGSICSIGFGSGYRTCCCIAPSDTGEIESVRCRKWRAQT
jgi:hypothetical protein